MSSLNSRWWTRTRVVLRKELRDHLRDRRSLILALFYPLLGPLLLGGGLYFTGSSLEHREEQVVEAPAIGVEYASQIVELAKELNVRFVDAPEDPKVAVRDGRIPLVVVFPEEARTEARFKVIVYENLSRVGNVAATYRVRNAIQLYNAKVAADLIRGAGLTRAQMSPLTIESVSVSRETNIAVYFYNLMPPLVIFMIFLSGVHLAIDTTAGERERGSLEPLLIAPVERWELMLAKALAAFIFTAVSVAFNLAAFQALLAFAAGSSEELLPPPPTSAFIAMFFVAIPIMAVAVTLQMSVAVITRSMKEAQIYLGLLPLVPALPGMIMVLAPMTPAFWNTSVPVLGQLLVFNLLTAGEPVPMAYLATATLTTTALAAFVFWRAAKLFRRENLFFLG